MPASTILAAARLLGVDEVRAAGGAQAVALLAYGGDRHTDGVELVPVDMITGPGNIYVTAAKRIRRSQVGIDAEAGPTEIAILADHTADPSHVAADLISQAEHDEMAAMLVTASAELADATDRELAAQLETTVHRKRVTAALTGRQSAIVLVDHLMLALQPSMPTPPSTSRSRPPTRPDVAARICSAGAIFVGLHSPVSPATTAPAPTTCCPLQAAPGIPAGCRCRRFCAGPRRRLHRGGAEGRVRLRHHIGTGRESARPRRGGAAEVRTVSIPGQRVTFG